ncbi:hypothetical protein H312_00848 [Anncaliia algerae PRA339]|uniref:Uncharacterized protein n=1 Tax=Anncaliia algerae PRA339 TaxID=1288291 RepID=A0A059F397_9MICR|nr:hypothetical protein H312_00848 [Anncaliia algerae PRA339]
MTEEFLKERYTKFIKANGLNSENIYSLLNECNLKVPFRRIKIPANYEEFNQLASYLSSAESEIIDKLYLIFNKNTLNKSDIATIVKNASFFDEDQLVLLYDHLDLKDEIDIEDFVKKVCIKQEI